MIFKRNRWRSVIDRQLAIFVEDNRDVIREAEEAEDAYRQAQRDDAEERYGEYVDAVETGTEILADMRDRFAATLGDDEANEYAVAFNAGVRKQLPRFGLEIDLR